jgi:hypothetical protein
MSSTAAGRVATSQVVLQLHMSSLLTSTALLLCEILEVLEEVGRKGWHAVLHVCKVEGHHGDVVGVAVALRHGPAILIIMTTG